MSKSLTPSQEFGILMMKLKQFHHLRDLEISNLWNRSLFLSVFVGIIFTGYGVVLFKTLDKDCTEIIYQILALSISIIGLIFSEIWILMSKSSKAWYEIYEKRIAKIESEISINPQWRYGYKGNDIMPRINNCIFSTKAGAYSPSRINIALGIIMFCIWIIPAITHFVNIFICVLNADRAICDKTICCCFLMLITFLIVLFLYLLAHKMVKSKHIKNKSL
ncbi:MAG: hypothetical protein SPL78_00515 [Bacteroidales bacterium]|nr:hypothetical protein [Bacteroidales bacterium]